MNKALVPEDFDWEYYVHAHPDLYRAGIKTQKLAEYHYAVYGNKENRNYKPEANHYITSKIISQQEKKPINPYRKTVFFVQWYLDEDTKENRLFCLNKNLENPHIDKIHIFCDSNAYADLYNSIQKHNKIQVSLIAKRLSYYDWMQYANKHYEQDIKILANSDIYFDKTLALLSKQSFNKHTLFFVTRKDLNKSGEIVGSCDYYGDSTRPTNPLYSQDVWIYESPLKANPNAFDFELGIENCDRLFKSNLSQEKIQTVNLFPKINAIHVDYRSIKNRAQYDLINNRKTNFMKNYSINKFIVESDLKRHPNELNAICLLLNGNEINDGYYDSFIIKLAHSIKESQTNTKTASTIDFNIYTQHTIDSNYTQALSKLFAKVNIIKSHIPYKYDFYGQAKSDQDTKYGDKSGPNYCFFDVFKYLKNYNTTLFLECDVIFQGDWLYYIDNYTKFSGGFWVSGSKYYNNSQSNLYSESGQHINGGVCLYATGHTGLCNYMNFCFNILPEYINHVNSGLPYDYLLHNVLVDFFDFDHDNRKIWNFIDRQITTNNLILNYSDISVSLDKIAKNYPNIPILHTKNSTND